MNFWNRILVFLIEYLGILWRNQKKLLGILSKAEIKGSVLKGIGLNIYPIIKIYNPDVKAFCQSMENQLNAVDCAKFIGSKVIPTWDMIDVVDYLQDDDLLTLVQSINI